MQQRSFGKLPSGERLELIRKSPNYREKVFSNQSLTRMLSEDASYFRMIRESFRKDPKRSPAVSLPSLKMDFAKAPGDKPVITWFGHSSYLIQAKGTAILVDPVFSQRASFAQYIGPSAYPGTMTVSVEDLPPIDMVIISHDHYDHLDYQTIRKLKDKVNAFYTPLGVGAHLFYWGVPEQNITELDWWDSVNPAEDLRLTATPARHFSGRGFTRNKTLWASYVLEIDGYKLYLGGDSGYDKHFKDIGNKFGPFDLVILENGQYNPQWPFIHMAPEETVQASIDLEGKVLLPVHWGKFTLAVHAWNDPAIRVVKKAKEMNVKVTTPRIGEPVIIDSIYPSDQWWDL